MYEFYVYIINQAIQKGDYDKASESFIQMIQKLMESNDSKLGEAYYEYAMFLFDIHEYELSVIMFKNAYELGFEKETIINFLYSCFIEPNKEQFELNFKNTLLSKRGSVYLEYIPLIEELVLDFIPLSENKYMIFNRESEKFNDIIDLSDKNFKKTQEVLYDDEFSDLVVIDNGMLKELWKHFEWASDRIIYCITKNATQMLSFMKLSEVAEQYFRGIYIFDSLNALESFLYQKSSTYVPKIIDSVDTFTKNSFYDMVRKVHKKRISSFAEKRENILLSICIPTFNRGHRVLESVESLIKLPYDSEIEIVVSNNGSTEYIEEYEKLKQIKDARFRYFEYKENQGFTANLYNVITMANGSYSLVLSDEDLLLPLALPYYFKVLSKMEGMAFGSTGTMNVYKYKNDVFLEKGEEALNSAFAHNNITGLIYNNRMFQSNKIIKDMVNDTRNEAIIYYPHLCWNLILNELGDFYQWNRILVREGKEEKTLAVNKDGTLPNESSDLPYYASMKSRFVQHDGFIQIINKINTNKVLCYCLLCEKLFFLIEILYKLHIKFELTKDEVGDCIYSYCVEKIDNLKLDSVIEKDGIIEFIKKARKKFV